VLVNITVLLGDLLETQAKMREMRGNKYIVRLSGYEVHEGTGRTAERSNFILKSKFKIECKFSICGGKTKDKWRPRKRR